MSLWSSKIIALCPRDGVSFFVQQNRSDGSVSWDFLVQKNQERKTLEE